MEPDPPPDAVEDPTVWEWSHLLDLPIDPIGDDVILPLSPPRPPPPPSPHLPQQQQQQAAAGRVRKRDPRLLCENFLSGRVPCSCPELDEAAEEEEDAAVGMVEKKRARSGGGGAASSGAPARCQVPGCEVDIGELKGYHRRHRVCLRCANATSVLLEGEAKRYCQQCGKFHVLADFDEGKRSCRRKLERHNRRRRRRPADNKSMMEKEKEVEEATDLDVMNGEQKKEATDRASFESDSLCMDDRTTDAEGLLDSEGHGSPYCSEPSIRTGHSNNLVSCAVSSDTLVEERPDNPKSVISSISENKRTYSTVCPTGRISFKLYDWNPAEFPRRLRLQILQWLASMPVELEGYIRPGCTILTIFIAMPQEMWNRLSNDSARHLHNFFKDPQNLFFGRGNIHIDLNNMLYQVLRDGTSLVNVKMEVQVPRLHYVHPLLFEAGKPVEFIACGSNLLRPKFRFLVSFAGKYFAGETCRAISHRSMRSCHDIEEESEQDCEHQMFKINFPSSYAEAFGPAFVEVENECGLSNFIPVLFADKCICSELQIMQQSQSFDPVSPKVRETGAISSFCKVHVSRQSKISELLLDIAWLLRNPQMEEDEVFLSTVNIQRVNNLLNHLLQSNSVNTLWKILCCLDSHLERFKSQEKLEISAEGCSSNMDWLERCMNNAKRALQKKSQDNAIVDLNSEILTNNVLYSDDKQRQLEAVPGVLDHVQGEVEVMPPMKQNRSLSFECKDESQPLLVGLLPQKGSDSCGMQIKWPVGSLHFSRKVITPRLLILVMASIFICCGLCVALLHPHMAHRMMFSARRCVSRAP